MLKNKLYPGAEAYYMNVGFTDRQKINETYNYLGGYVQGGYFVAPRLQAALRYDFFNMANSTPTRVSLVLSFSLSTLIEADTPNMILSSFKRLGLP